MSKKLFSSLIIAIFLFTLFSFLSSEALANLPPGCKQIGSGSSTTFSCNTGLGVEVQTDPQNFAKSFFGIILSISGSVALLLIIVSGYRLMTSGGNPEKVQGAREQLTSAITGLLFVIFSVFILQFIGVTILKIPGFG